MEFSELLINKVTGHYLNLDIFYFIFALTISLIISGTVFVSEKSFEIGQFMIIMGLIISIMGGYFTISRIKINRSLSLIIDYIILNRQNIDKRTTYQQRDMLYDITSWYDTKPSNLIDHRKIICNWQKYYQD